MKKHVQRIGVVMKSKLEGKICLRTGNQKRPTIKCSLQSEKDLGLSDYLMNNFKHLDLSAKEKQKFSKKYREHVTRYNNLSTKELTKLSEEFSKSVKEQINSGLKDETVHIHAEDIGVFVCLAAIFSGNLPKEYNFCFHFSLVPTICFPKNLYKENKTMNYQIEFEKDKNSWLLDFKSLYSWPEYMNIPSDNYKKVA